MNTVHRRTLENGLRVAVVPIPGLRSAATLLATRAGQWFEPAGRPGIARLAAQALIRGTVDLDAAAWADALDALGASARLDVGSHAAVFSGQCLAADLRRYLDLVAGALCRPAFAAAEVELVRAQTIAALEEAAKDTRAVAERAWRELAYPAGHPFHTRPAGDDAVVRSATAEELRAFHGAAVHPAGSVLVVAGGIDPDAAFDAAIGAFGDWRGAARPEAPPAAVTMTAIAKRVEELPDKTQSDVVLGWLGIPRTDPRFTRAQVANMVFAADTFASRAGHVVRDELGLAYYVFSTIAGTLGQGPWVVRMGVNPENVDRAIAETLNELRKIHNADIADDDLALARDKLVGELDVALESPGGVAALVLEAELFDLGDDHFERYPRELRAVTKDEVVEIARELLTLDRYALAIAGPPAAR